MENQERLTEPLSRDLQGTPLWHLHTTLCRSRGFDVLRNPDKQQDAQEFLNPLLDLALNGQTFGLVTEKTSQDETRDPRLIGLHVPSVDTKLPAARESMVFVEIPERETSYSIQNYFNGTAQLEGVDVDAILGSEYNQKSLTADRRKGLQREKSFGEPFGEIATTVSHQLQRPVPSFLPVYIPRFQNYGEGGAKTAPPLQLHFVSPFR